MQSLRKLSPLPQLSPLNTRPPWPPWESKKFFGMFLASILAQVSRNITKYNMNAEFKKTGPPQLSPLAPLGVKKIFWDVSGIYLSSSLKKYYQKYQECRF